MDDNTLLQLEGYVESVVYRNEENGYTVVEISDDDDYITAVGIMPRVHQGDLLKLTGNIRNILITAGNSLPRSVSFAVRAVQQGFCVTFLPVQSVE